MTENQFKSLHHLTQSKMLIMTEFDDEKFYEAINDEDFEFPTKKKKPLQKPSDFVMSDEKYKELMGYDKALIIKYYDELYREKLALIEKIESLQNQRVA